MNEIPLIIDGLSSCTKGNKIEVSNNFSWKQCIYLKNHFFEVLIGLELFGSIKVNYFTVLNCVRRMVCTCALVKNCYYAKNSLIIRSLDNKCPRRTTVAPRFAKKYKDKQTNKQKNNSETKILFE